MSKFHELVSDHIAAGNTDFQDLDADDQTILAGQYILTLPEIDRWNYLEEPPIHEIAQAMAGGDDCEVGRIVAEAICREVAFGHGIRDAFNEAYRESRQPDPDRWKDAIQFEGETV